MAKEIVLKNGKIILVDDEDFEKVGKYSWNISTGKNYVSRSIQKNKKSYRVSLAKFILELYDENYNDISPVDENGMKYAVMYNDIDDMFLGKEGIHGYLNLQKSNLRLVPNSEARMTANKFKKKNANSKFMHVSIREIQGQKMVYASINNRMDRKDLRKIPYSERNEIVCAKWVNDYILNHSKCPSAYALNELPENIDDIMEEFYKENPELEKVGKSYQ